MILAMFYNEKVSDGIYLSINTGLTRMPIFPSDHDGSLLAGTFTRVRAHGGRGWRTMPRTGSVRSDVPPSQMPVLPVALECQWEGGPHLFREGRGCQRTN